MKAETQFIDTHFEALKRIPKGIQGYVGTNSLNWANKVFPNLNFGESLNKKFERNELFDYCKNPENSDLDVLVAVLSWGGKRYDQGRLLENQLPELLSLVKDLRNGKFLTRKEAFSKLQSMRESGELLGLGIGFYTKLICFLAPNLNGYIMDQWLAKSINLLTGKQEVELTGNWVNDNNTPETYERFCSYIDTLGESLGYSGIDAEEILFSVGGKKKGAWRNYLINNY